MGKLSVKAFEKIARETKPGNYVDGDGLMVVIKASKNKKTDQVSIRRSWMLRIQVEGKRRDIGLGSLDDVTLAEARDKTEAMRKQARAGVDPLAQKRAEKLSRMTIPVFSKAAESAHGEQKATWRNDKHKAQWLSTLETYANPTLGDVRIDQITAPMIRDVLLPIWLTKPETARRVRQRIRAVMGWAASKGYCPAIDLTVMDSGLPKQPKRDGHFAAMDWQDVPAFVAKVRDAPETVGRMALLFTLLTAARSGEVRGATWDEMDLEAAVWTIPGKRMKAGRDHVVPLSEPALAILARAEALRTDRKDAPIFLGRGGSAVSDMTMTKVMRDAGHKDSVHGFRSSFKDWASENTSFPDAVSEAALAHTDPNKVRRSYRRTDFFKMRVDLMAAWASYVDGAKEADNVVPIGAATKLAG